MVRASLRRPQEATAEAGNAGAGRGLHRGIAEYNPNGAGAIVFAVLAVSAEVEREGIREKTLEGLEAAARKGNVGGRPSVVDDDKLAVARARHAKGDSVTAIAKALGIGRATLYRHLGESA
ncbi:recombinase family protein [Streptomyces sp. NPDC058876]|uniref:recombinase family protein n=1 Tax=Streptomyces sp. NPDC058876 TaxID=3346664 RepID=UPI00367AB709